MSKTLKRGTYVSRAAFAKMQGERDRLLKDVYTMVMDKNLANVILVKQKWEKEFTKNKLLGDVIREFALKYKDLTDPKIDSNPKAFK